MKSCEKMEGDPGRTDAEIRKLRPGVGGAEV